ncbi:MAG: hypothetical protein ACOYK6_00405 [Chthoniobacterales bacterium]
MKIYKFLLTIVICSALHAETALVASPNSVTIMNRQLLVDERPFVMQGICYNPVRKGETEQSGLITINPTKEDLLTIEKDFKMMREAGFNTIRTYRPILHRQVLDLLSKYQLKTIVPVYSHYLRDTETDLIQVIEMLKDEPSTLLWEIGNEWNLNHFYTHDSTEWILNHLCHPVSDEVKKNILSYSLVSKELSNLEGMQIIEHVASLIREKDRLHPISTNILDPKRISDAIENHDYYFLSDSIDLYGINVYDGLSFGSRFDFWKQLSSKPCYIGEFGADAWNQDINDYDPDSQKQADLALLEEIMNNLSARDPNNILVGGCIFEWNDEWWKDRTGSADKHDTNGVRPDEGGPFPDHSFTEEWWGIVDIERNPRPVYDAIKKLYHGNCSFPSRDNQ